MNETQQASFIYSNNVKNSFSSRLQRNSCARKTDVQFLTLFVATYKKSLPSPITQEHIKHTHQHKTRDEREKLKKEKRKFVSLVFVYISVSLCSWERHTDILYPNSNAYDSSYGKVRLQSNQNAQQQSKAGTTSAQRSRKTYFNVLRESTFSSQHYPPTMLVCIIRYIY